MDDERARAIHRKWPRGLVPPPTHYVLHKVAIATVRNGAILLTCVGNDGRSYGPGPYHPSVFKDHRRPIRQHLSEWGMERVEQIKYVVAYHSGGFVNGIVVRLLKSEEDVEALVARLIEVGADKVRTDGPIERELARFGGGTRYCRIRRASCERDHEKGTGKRTGHPGAG